MYGYPGDGVGGLDVALEKAKDFMRYLQVRHEEMAAFMASAHAKFTGQLGLCYATSGPGAIHLLTGLYDAKADHVPVVTIVGQQARTALGASYQQEVDLQNLFKDVASEFVMTTIEKNVASWWETLEARAMSSADPINPQRVFWELSPRLPENCILTANSGSTPTGMRATSRSGAA